MRNAYKSLVGNQIAHLGNTSLKERSIESNLKRHRIWGCDLDSNSSGKSLVADSCEQSNELSGPMEGPAERLSYSIR